MDESGQVEGVNTIFFLRNLQEDAELLQAVRSQAVGELPDPEDIEWSIVKSKLPQRSGAQLRDR